MYQRFRLPPCGGSGLKFVVAADIAGLKVGLPPCGGSGLKCDVGCADALNIYVSPSMRREWIEILFDRSGRTIIIVSLHAEGVD